MAAPNEQLLRMMTGAKAPAPAAPPAGQTPAEPIAMSDQETPPMAAPMSTPEPKMGSREGAMINISMALDLLEQSLPALGAQTPEGERAMQAIRTLNAMIGPRKDRTNELQSAQILQMLQALPQGAGTSPETRMVGQAPIPGMPSAMAGTPAM
jgi:hypothetical protein